MIISVTFALRFMFVIEFLLKVLLADSKEEYISNYQDESWERSLSRSKRSLLTPLMNLFGKGFTVIMKPIFHLSIFTFEVLLGIRECSNMKDIPKELFPRFGSISIEMVKAIICHIGSAIGAQGRKVLLKILQYLLSFMRTVIIPGLHKILNKVKDTGILPPSIVGIITTFNVIYDMMRLLGYL